MLSSGSIHRHPMDEAKIFSTPRDNTRLPALGAMRKNSVKKRRLPPVFAILLERIPRVWAERCLHRSKIQELASRVVEFAEDGATSSVAKFVQLYVHVITLQVLSHSASGRKDFELARRPLHSTAIHLVASELLPTKPQDPLICVHIVHRCAVVTRKHIFATYSVHYNTSNQ